MQTDSKGVQPTTAYFTAWTCSSFDEAMGDVSEKIMLDSHMKLRTALNFGLDSRVQFIVIHAEHVVHSAWILF